MARHFDHASGNYIRTTLGTGPTSFPYGTIAAILKASTDPGFYTWISARDSGGNWIVLTEMWAGNWSVAYTSGASTTLNGDGITITAADGWCLLAITKGDGSVIPRFHKYQYSTGTWTHSSNSGVTANGGGTIDHWMIGSRGQYDEWDGPIAIAGCAASKALSDNEIESLAYGITPWLSTMTHVWPLWQASSSDKVIDLVSGANENTGSSIIPAVSSEAAPWGLGLPALEVVKGAVSGFNPGQFFGVPGTAQHLIRTGNSW